jgi:hypothetical protein
MQSAKTADFRYAKQMERMTRPWLSSLINKIQSKTLLVWTIHVSECVPCEVKISIK